METAVERSVLVRVGEDAHHRAANSTPPLALLTSGPTEPLPIAVWDTTSCQRVGPFRRACVIGAYFELRRERNQVGRWRYVLDSADA